MHPGEGLKHIEWADDVRHRLYRFRDGKTGLGTLLEDQRGADWWRYYVEGLGLNADEIAFANIAWCATQDNRYPRTVLRRCFERHTSRLLEILRPRVVLVAGGIAQAFTRDVSALPSSPHVIPMLHHAHREGRSATEREFKRVQWELRGARVALAG